MARILTLLAAAVLALVLILPVAWLVILAVSSQASVTTLPLRWIPAELDLTRFARLVAPQETGAPSPYVSGLWNSVRVAAAATATALVVSTLAGWALSRGKPREALMSGMVATYMLPQAALALPLYGMLAAFGLLNNPMGLALTYLGFIVPFTVWLLKSGFDQIPRELDDAARVDGLGGLGVLLHVGLPLSRATVATTALFAILMSWDEFFYALLFTSNAAAKTVTVAIVDFTSGRIADYGMVAAAGLLAAVPPVLIGFLLQRHLVQGLTAGGVKG